MEVSDSTVESIGSKKYEPEIQVSESSDADAVPADFDSEENDIRQGCWEKFKFFVKHSYRDVGRHPCHFCLAFCSVFIVVLSTLVVTTIIAQGPIIFVSLAQVESGEMDFWYTAQDYDTTPVGQSAPMNQFDYF